MTNEELLLYYDHLWGEIDRKENPVDFWNKRADGFNRKSSTKKNRLTDTVDFLLEHGMAKTDTVLDIGCATGKLAMKMYPHVAYIHGTDVSPKMIQYAKENVADAKLENLSFEVSTWSDVDIVQKGWVHTYDWVIASMTPAIQNLDTLKKMIQVSKKHCFIATIVERKNLLEEELRKHFPFVERRTDFKQGTNCIFNLLWLMGYTPEVRYIETTYQNELTIEEGMNIFHIHSLDLAQKQQIQVYFEQSCVNGKIIESANTKVAFIYWQVS